MKSLALLALFVPALAVAQPSAEPTYALIGPAPAPPPSSPSVEKTDSINISPLGVLFGSYAIGYEHLFAGQHGLIVEGTFTHSSTADSTSTTGGGAVGYRWHWRGRQNSGFLGFTASQAFGRGDSTVTDGNAMTRLRVGLRATTLTANVGKRWMLTDALNLTIRFGLGWAHYAVHAEVDSMEAKQAEKQVNDLLARFPVGVDGELSLGYTF